MDRLAHQRHHSRLNTKLISPAELPSSYDDLADPRWKGRLAVESGDSNIWLMGVAAVRGEQDTVDLFRRIVATNGVSLRRGHVALANLVAAGEVPFALTAYRNNADQLADAGAPVQTKALPPLLALPSGIGITRRASHPYSAVLFWEYYLTEGQKFLVAQRNVPTNRRVKEPELGLTFIDPNSAPRRWRQVAKAFSEHFRHANAVTGGYGRAKLSGKQQRLDDDGDHPRRREQLAEIDEVEILQLHAVDRHEAAGEPKLVTQQSVHDTYGGHGSAAF